jgi:hypothetical protein
MTRKQLQLLAPGMQIKVKSQAELDPFDSLAYSTVQVLKIFARCETTDGSLKAAIQFVDGQILKTLTTYPGDSRIIFVESNLTSPVCVVI